MNRIGPIVGCIFLLLPLAQAVDYAENSSGKIYPQPPEGHEMATVLRLTPEDVIFSLPPEDSWYTQAMHGNDPQIWFAKYAIRSTSYSRLEYVNVWLLHKKFLSASAHHFAPDPFYSQVTRPNGDVVTEQIISETLQGIQIDVDLVPTKEDWTIRLGLQWGAPDKGPSPIDIHKSGPDILEQIVDHLRGSSRPYVATIASADWRPKVPTRLELPSESNIDLSIGAHLAKIVTIDGKIYLNATVKHSDSLTLDIVSHSGEVDLAFDRLPFEIQHKLLDENAEAAAYRKRIWEEINIKWKSAVMQSIAKLDDGWIKVRFVVRSDGTISDQRIVGEDGNSPVFRDICLHVIMGQVEPFPSMLATKLKAYPDEYDFTLR